LEGDGILILVFRVLRGAVTKKLEIMGSF